MVSTRQTQDRSHCRCAVRHCHHWHNAHVCCLDLHSQDGQLKFFCTGKRKSSSLKVLGAHSPFRLLMSLTEVQWQDSVAKLPEFFQNSGRILEGKKRTQLWQLVVKLMHRLLEEDERFTSQRAA
jgi:hypothetical protein